MEKKKKANKKTNKQGTNFKTRVIAAFNLPLQEFDCSENFGLCRKIRRSRKIQLQKNYRL